MKTHYALYPFSLGEGNAGGLPSVFLSATRMERDLVLFTTNDVDGPFGNAHIVSTRVNKSDFDNLRRYWFGIGCWQWLHPDAHTDNAGDPDANRFMLGMPTDACDVSLEDLLLYCEKNGSTSDLNVRFNSWFDAAVERIPPSSVVNWQDYFFVPTLIKNAERLRSLGVFQTLHIHTAIPDSLGRTEFGKNLLKAISAVDVAYFHTDEYVRRVEKQLSAARLPIPPMKRFDLGIDHAILDQGLRHIEAGHLAELVPQHVFADSKRNEFVTEIFRSRGTVPHRFICVDRVDPAKGTATVVKAILKFLEIRRVAGESLSDLQAKYRFFFLQPSIGESFDFQNLQTGWYGRYLRDLFKQVMDCYPGVLFFSDGLQGKDRLLVPALMLDANGITGGAQDGLNLAVMENAYVNRGMDTSIICGDGAGFAMHAKASGLTEHGFFPAAGDVSAFVTAIEEIVRLQARTDSSLRHRKAPLVAHIMRRSDSVLVDR